MRLRRGEEEKEDVDGGIRWSDRKMTFNRRAWVIYLNKLTITLQVPDQRKLVTHSLSRINTFG